MTLSHSLRWIGSGMLLAVGALCFAQPPAGPAWADPTRPPIVAAADPGTSAPRAAKAASAPAPAAPRLQSLQVGGGKANALVDGRIVEVGDALGTKHVAVIDAEGLTLRDANGRSERLLLISAAIDKRDGGSPRPVAALSNGQDGREGRRP